MSEENPIYTDANCESSYKLYWSLATFTTAKLPDTTKWLEDLKIATEPDGVRILEHHIPSEQTHQFLLSSKPHVAPDQIIRSVKGRLQYLIRDDLPKALHRNYYLQSVGPANCEILQQYIGNQLDHHQMADPNVQKQLGAFQIHCEDVDLNAVRRSGHGQFIYDLHVVFSTQGRWNEIRPDILGSESQQIRETANRYGHLLGDAGILPDHKHIGVGCGITESPSSVAITYLNSLAKVYGMKAVFEFGFFVGTFGPYDLDAIRRTIRGEMTS